MYVYIQYCAYTFLTTECIEALSSPPPTATTTNTSLPKNDINSSSGSHHSTTLHQTSSGRSVIGSAQTLLASQPPQGLLVHYIISIRFYTIHNSPTRVYSIAILCTAKALYISLKKIINAGVSS